MTSITSEFEMLLSLVLKACRKVYGERLLSLAIFGSVGRGTPRPDSDIDLLIVASDLPEGRVRRAREFQQVEELLAAALRRAREQGLNPELSPVFKTPAELEVGSPLLLDMVDDARILYDKGGLLGRSLGELRARLERLGARRVWRDQGWYWDLKPDYRPGEVFEL